MNKVFFTSDLHFHHKRIVELSNRGVDTNQENHDEWLIDLWNSQVNSGDVVYHLGDFSFSDKYNEIESIIEKLNGNIFLIKGNHDKREILASLEQNKKVVKVFDYLERKFNKIDFILFHYPIGSFNKQRYGAFHLHGHSHGNYSDTKGRMLDVGPDSAYNIFGRHKFFSLENVVEILKDKKIYIADSHRSGRNIL